MDDQNQMVTSWIRTMVPIVLGPVLAWLAQKVNIPIDQGAVFTWVSAALGAAYYALARWLEMRYPNIPVFQYLLGSAKKPVYTTPPVTPAKAAEAAKEVQEENPPK